MKRNVFFLLFILLPLIGNAQSEKNIIAPDPGIPVPLTARDMYSVIDLHNRTRCQLQTPAAVMPTVTWNSLLYQVAQNYANKCVFQHNVNRVSDYAALGGTGYVGENIFWIGPAAPTVFLPAAINAFASEKANFSYVPSSSCNGGLCGCQNLENCGHYTQLIWADTKTVACAQADCSNTELGGQLIVCDYAPGGNLIGAEPYVSSSRPIDTASCSTARIVPLSFLSSLTVSSNQDQASTILDSNAVTFWTPADDDVQPFVTLALDQPLNIKNIRVRWSNVNHSANAVRVEYSTQVDGSNLQALTIQALPFNINATIDANLSQIRFLKINFLGVHNSKLELASLAAVDPTFSWNW